MRANEFITETINPDILNPKFEHQQEIGDFILTAKHFTTPGYGQFGPRQQLIINCYHSGIVNRNFLAGYAVFEIHGKGNQKWLESEDTNVFKDFRGQNIASTIYAYAKMLGNDVKPSTIQLKPGKDMWKAWKKSGEAEHLMKEEINPDILNPQFRHTQEIGDYVYTAEVSSDYGQELIIRAFDGKEEIGKCEFEILGNEKFSRYEKNPRLVSNRTWVDPVYREMGIATTMYAYAKMLGNDIMPHEVQSDAGSRMWQSWNQSKQSKHILPKGEKGYRELDEDSGVFSKVMTHETTPEAAAIIMKTGFKPSQTGIFFNVAGTNYSGGGYGGTEIRAQITGPIDDILNLEDDNDLPDDLDDFADGEEIANYAREEGYWAWTDGVQFAVLDPRHIKVIPTNG